MLLLARCREEKARIGGGLSRFYLWHTDTVCLYGGMGSNGSTHNGGENHIIRSGWRRS